MNKKILIVLLGLVVLGILSGTAIAVFGDKGKILGSSFTVGSADIKLLKNLAGGTSTDNLTDEIAGPAFTNISPGWTKDYLIKIYNNASSHVQLTSNAYYETLNDPDELRSFIYVEPFNWNDANNNGELETNELGSSFGKKTIIKWKTEGYDLSSMATGLVKGLVLRFSADAISETKQGKSGIFDFVFDTIAIQ